MYLLDGIKVISFNRFLLGPVGIQLIADLGTDVITVEPLEGAFQRKWGGGNRSVGDQTVLFLAGDRNKRSLTIDLKSEVGLEIARKLCVTADVVVENFRPGVMEKPGLGCDDLKAENPSLIYAAASGFGVDGPYAARSGQDLLIQAMSSLMAITGSKEGGARAVGVSAADHHGAALFAMGILAALVGQASYRPGLSGRCGSAVLGHRPAARILCLLSERRGSGERASAEIHRWLVLYPAPYGIYPTKDGELAISLVGMDVLSEALELPELAGIDFAEAFEQREKLADTIAETIAGRTTIEWQEILDRHGIWHAPVNDYEAVATDPQVRHNGNFIALDGAEGKPIKLVSHPARYDGKAPEVRLPPQRLIAQSAEILAELGYRAREIERLAADGVIVVDKGD